MRFCLLLIQATAARGNLSTGNNLAGKLDPDGSRSTLRKVFFCDEERNNVVRQNWMAQRDAQGEPGRP